MDIGEQRGICLQHTLNSILYFLNYMIKALLILGVLQIRLFKLVTKNLMNKLDQRISAVGGIIYLDYPV